MAHMTWISVQHTVVRLHIVLNHTFNMAWSEMVLYIRVRFSYGAALYLSESWSKCSAHTTEITHVAAAFHYVAWSKDLVHHRHTVVTLHMMLHRICMWHGASVLQGAAPYLHVSWSKYLVHCSDITHGATPYLHVA